jgi:hypothetical protein
VSAPQRTGWAGVLGDGLRGRDRPHLVGSQTGLVLAWPCPIAWGDAAATLRVLITILGEVRVLGVGKGEGVEGVGGGECGGDDAGCGVHYLLSVGCSSCSFTGLI